MFKKKEMADLNQLFAQKNRLMELSNEIENLQKENPQADWIGKVDEILDEMDQIQSLFYRVEVLLTKSEDRETNDQLLDGQSQNLSQ